MSEFTDEAWILSSGLRDDMVISVYDAYFATDAEYQGGRQYLLHLIGTDEKTEPVTLKMSVGADWQSADGGVTITHPTKQKQRINSSTIYGHWITCASEIPELVAELQRRPGGPTNAKVWEGLIIHATEREIKFGKTIEPQMRLMPAEYFGLIQEVQAPQGIPNVPPTPLVQPAYAPPPAPAYVPPVAPVAAQIGIAPVPVVDDGQAALAAARAAAANTAAPVNPLYQHYWELAKVTEWGPFLAAALADTNVLQDEELAQQIVNQGLLWTQARS